MPPEDVSDEVLEEGCYYLTKLGLGASEVARHFEVTDEEVSRRAAAYGRKLKDGSASSEPFDLQFWEDVKKEAEGDVKLTFVSDKGFHHSWKSEVSRLDVGALMNIYESSRDFLSADPNQKFLDYPPPKGYDPLAAEREVKKAVEFVKALLEEMAAKGERSTKAGGRPPA